MKRTAVFFLVLVVLTGLTSRAQLTTIAYDGFNYSSGSLAGLDGGTGWTGSWTHDYTSGGDLDVTSTGLTYSGLNTSGGSVVWGSGGNGISEDSRTLPLVDSGVVYFQFLSQFGSGSGGGTPNIRLYDSGTVTGGFGGNGVDVMSILNASLQTDAAASTSASLADLNLTIVQINYQTDTTEMWVNPDLSTFNYLNPTAPDATYADFAPVFNAIGIYSRSPGNVDEIEVAETPEPTTLSLAMLGIIAFWWKRRRQVICPSGRG